MATTVMQAGQGQHVGGSDFSMFQRLILRRFHPRSLFIDSVGLIWFVYYFWNQDWQTALAIAVVFRMIAIASVQNVDAEKMSQTILGKIGLLHLQPINLVTQIVGSLILLYGLWEHATPTTLIGLSLILLGHVFGWDKVDPRLRTKA